MATRHDHPVHRTHQPTAHREQSQEHGYSPFSLMKQGLEEMDRLWGRLAERGWSSAAAQGRNWMSQVQHMGDWMPAIEAFQRGNEFVVRAEVPGMARTDINVEVGDDALTIRGERKHEQREESEGMFWSERGYGTFCRVVPLPPGTISDSAKASFSNGVLEVVMQTPSPEARRGRKVDISGASEK